MSNYSKFSQILHKQFLSKGKISELLTRKLKEESKGFNLNKCKHIFITGLARSGTTALLNALDSTNELGSLRYKYMPFIFSAKLAKIFSSYFSGNNINQIERMHGDGLKINNNSAECLDEPFWINEVYKNHNFDKFLSSHSFSEEIAKCYGYLLDKFLKIENKNRLIIKNNNHHLRLSSLTSYYPKSIFLIIFREPVAHAYSLNEVNKKLIKIQTKDNFVLDYMNLIGHWEFGQGKKFFKYNDPNEFDLNLFEKNEIEYWLKQWINTYQYILIFTLGNKQSNFKLICYEDLCTQKSYVNQIYKTISINKRKIKFDFKLGKFNSKVITNAVDKGLIIRAQKIYSDLREISKISLKIN